MDPVYCRAMTDDDIINECSEDNPLTYDIALETLKEVHSYCEEYITTRNSLAYLLPFRIMLNNKGQQ